jgi:hypothetical protein
MINCSIHNYHEWIDAYLNGHLNREDMLSAEAFLQQHPQLLDTYLDALEEFSLEPEQVEFFPKEELKMNIVPTAHIHPGNFTEYFIGSAEGNLTEEEKTELDSFLNANPKLKKEFDLYALAKVSADLSIQYPDTKSLLKRSRPAVPLFWTFSAAASIILLVGLWFLWPSPSGNSPGLAVTRTNRTELKLTANHQQPTIVINKDPKLVEENTTQKEKQVVVKIQNSQERTERSSPVAMENNRTVQLYEIAQTELHSQEQLALKTFVPVDTNPIIINEEVADNKPKKKGLFNKLLNGDKTYIEDYVNATFSVFKSNKNEDDKWALKVDRDSNGKSKKVKFTSPIFSTKSRN